MICHWKKSKLWHAGEIKSHRPIRISTTKTPDAFRSYLHNNSGTCRLPMEGAKSGQLVSKEFRPKKGLINLGGRESRACQMAGERVDPPSHNCRLLNHRPPLLP